MSSLILSPKREKDVGRARESGPGNEVTMCKEIIPQPSPTRVATFPSDYDYVLWYLLWCVLQDDEKLIYTSTMLYNIRATVEDMTLLGFCNSYLRYQLSVNTEKLFY